MEFTSLLFWLLTAATFGLYYFVVPSRYQPHLLIVSSLLFYAYASPWLLLLLLLSTAVSGLLSYLVQYGPLGRVRLFLLGGVCLNLFVLCLFKYAGLIIHTFLGAVPPQSGMISLLLSLPLPVGLSFYTFEGVSLLVDTYRRRTGGDEELVPHHKWQHATTTTLFVSFFPHLISGPILKAHQFFPQIHPHSFAAIKWQRALTDITVGYFLKLVVANNLQDYAAFIDAPIGDQTTGQDLVASLLSYTFQLFSDFAGYSLVALGIARLFGYELPANFNFPYLSTSFKEFWSRWHISLSTWLRDYLYIPLGGNRMGALRTYANLMIVMLLGGLWHGAAWNFAVWGGIHGAALSIERMCARLPFTASSLPLRIARWLVVFTTVSVAWLFFRLPDVPSAVEYIRSIKSHWIRIRTFEGFTYIIFFSLPVILYHLHGFVRERMGRELPGPLKAMALGVMVYLTLTTSGFSLTFLYFQF